MPALSVPFGNGLSWLVVLKFLDDDSLVVARFALIGGSTPTLGWAPAKEKNVSSLRHRLTEKIR